MARTYPNDRTGARHTYKFYKQRRNDSKWHDTFIEVRSIRRWETFFTIVILVLLLLIGLVIFRDKIPFETSGSVSSKTVTHLTKNPSNIVNKENY